MPDEAGRWWIGDSCLGSIRRHKIQRDVEFGDRSERAYHAAGDLVPGEAFHDRPLDRGIASAWLCCGPRAIPAQKQADGDVGQVPVDDCEAIAAPRANPHHRYESEWWYGLH